MEAVYAFDLKVFEWISAHLWNAFLDTVMAVISLTGEGGIIWIAFALILLCFKKTRKIGLCMGAALLFMLVVNNIILKNVFARPRPYDYTGYKDFIYPAIGYKKPHSLSFPSGHTSSSFAAATVLMIMNKKMGIPAAVYAFLMGFSRIYLYDHYCTDVLAGIALGIIYGIIGYLIVIYAEKLIIKRKNVKSIH